MPSTDSKSTTQHSSGYFDSHCHLNDIHDLANFLTQANTQDIKQFVIPGTHSKQWPEVINTANNTKSYAAIGTHPWFVQNPQLEAEQLVLELSRDKVVAVGEIGLDYFVGEVKRPDKKLQLNSFVAQLKVAQQHGLPVIIHCVKAHQDCLNILKAEQQKAGVIHAFSASFEIAEQYRNLGFALGIGPLLLRSKKLQNCIARLPLHSLLLETDAPYLTKVAPGENPLLQLIAVAQLIAQLHGVDVEQVRDQTRLNAERIFKAPLNNSLRVLQSGLGSAEPKK